MTEQAPMPPQDFVTAVSSHVNLVGVMDDGVIGRHASLALMEYRLDKASMSEWLEKMGKGIDLAKLDKEKKTYPFSNASNVKYPLVTSAALQFNARAYPAIVQADKTVKTKTYGADQNGQKAARGERVSAHMSWQLQCELEEWEADTDRMLVQLPVVGTMIRKTWYDAAQERPRSRLIEPGKFIVNNNVKTLETAPRSTEEISLFPSEIRERVASGVFADLEYHAEDSEDTAAPVAFIEQHCRLDLDGDGYGEPYIITVHVASQKCARLVADFDGPDVKYITGMDEAGQQVATGIKSIRRGSYFTAYHFMPSLSGGFWGTGLGLLLGDISETVNTIINMQIDAGHMASLGGGFIGNGFRLKGGSQNLKPGEWRQVQATGASIKDSMVPITFPGPDATLFQMLGLLIDAGREIASVKDILTGDTGTKNMTATTTMALIEQGLMVFSAAYKRIYLSLRHEFKILAKINAATVDPARYNEFHDQEQQFDPAQDYAAADMDIVPVADPKAVTKMQELAKADLLMNMASQGLVNPGEATNRILEAASIPDRDELAMPQDPAAQMMQQAQMAQVMAELELTRAKVQETYSDAAKNMADADRARMEQMIKMMEAQRNELQATLAGGFGRMAGAPGNAMPGVRDARIVPMPARPNGSGVPIGSPMGSGQL